MGVGIYITHDVNVACSFANRKLQERGVCRVLRCKVRPDLRMLENPSSEFLKLRKAAGGGWATDGPKKLAALAKRAGYDGVVYKGSDPLMGAVIFDRKNVQCRRVSASRHPVLKRSQALRSEEVIRSRAAAVEAWWL
jgi:hypothetical protein